MNRTSIHKLILGWTLGILLFFPAQSPAAGDCAPLPVVPQKYIDMAAERGLTIDLEDFYKDSDGKAVDQKEIEKFFDGLFTNMNLLKPEFIQLSRCRHIFPRKNMQANGYFIGGKKKGIVVKLASVNACNHELFHAYDLFVFSPRFWKTHNHPDFTYGGRGFMHKGIGESTYGQLWRAGSNISRFAPDFMRSYGQVNSHEDAAVVFENMIDPQRAGKLRQQMRKSRYLKQKVLLTAAQTSIGMGQDYWQKKLGFSPAEIAEFNQFRASLDLEKQYHLKIHYNADQLQRYGFQLRTTYALLELSKEFIAASGLKEIRFQQTKGSRSGTNVITVEDGNPYSLIFRIFMMYCKNTHVNFATDHPCLTVNEAARLFGQMLLNPEKSAKRAFKAHDYRQKIDHLKKITASHLPMRFWAEYDLCLQDLEMEEQVRKHFADSGIRFIRELPAGVSGTIVSEKEQANAEKTLQLCCYLFSQDFLQKSGYRKIVFAKKMQYKGKSGGHWGIGDTLCLSPGLTLILFHFTKECYMRYDAGRKHPDWKWKSSSPQAARKSPDFLFSGDARSPLQERARLLAAWIASWQNLQEKCGKSAILKAKTFYVLHLPVFSPYAAQLFRQREQGDFSLNVRFSTP